MSGKFNCRTSDTGRLAARISWLCRDRCVVSGASASVRPSGGSGCANAEKKLVQSALVSGQPAKAAR